MNETNRRIYLDHNATTPVRREVASAVAEAFLRYGGNPSSSYESGRRARKRLEEARGRIASLFGASPEGVVFTGSGTEADNLAVRGVALAAGRGSLLLSNVEHPAVEKPARSLERLGFSVARVGVGEEGTVDAGRFAAALAGDTILASLIHGQNETGVLQPVRSVGRACRERGVPFHTDAAQTAGKLPIDLEKDPFDLVTVVGHKIYGPKGVAALLVRGGVSLEPVLLGGGQERGRRPGTENVPLAVGLAKALEIAAAEREEEAERIGAMRDRFEEQLARRAGGVRFAGRDLPRIPGTSYLLIEGVSGMDVAASLDRLGIEVSTGSACHAGSPEPSAVLTAMGVDRSAALGGVRVGFGHGNDDSQMERIVGAFASTIERLRRESDA